MKMELPQSGGKVEKFIDTVKQNFEFRTLFLKILQKSICIVITLEPAVLPQKQMLNWER